MPSDRTVLSHKHFSPADLLRSMESLLKESKQQQRRQADKSNYSWLKSRYIESHYDSAELEEFKPIVFKMSSEACTLAAVKLDSLVEHAHSPAEVLTAIKNVIEEQQTADLLERAVRRAKEKKGKSKTNRVHPELFPPGRQPTVSFLLN